MQVKAVCLPFRLHPSAFILSLHPLVGDSRLDLDGNFADVLLARRAHRLLDRLRRLRGLARARLDDNLVVDDVDGLRARALQTVVQQPKRTFDDVSRTPLNGRILAAALGERGGLTVFGVEVEAEEATGDGARRGA